ncbi:MAG: hypothetical protein J6W29_04100 [Neisseriaceae bacterium]|nr:hypothetical protein [Neisseriaceae bacterium]
MANAIPETLAKLYFSKQNAVRLNKKLLKYNKLTVSLLNLIDCITLSGCLKDFLINISYRLFRLV